ncbi:GTP cyclohydrolase FolE2 [Caldilinea sp.]|uniref:GTP cyclohydrolase FolE2 n=1 Tax=Caldilinea sp. TaxID=2293560 RepID=UPI002BE7B208|nr:GTP cyclohydrolase FolE2 [Caldilinea sp.]HRA66193.1 GTP cyclohydrolase FolE2 [Caldilinea sp.]
MKFNDATYNGNGSALFNSKHVNGKYTNGAGVIKLASPLLTATRSQPERYYDPDFVVTDAYRDSLPDLQNGPASLIQGSPVAIQQVGIHNFRLPLRYASRTGEPLLLETSVTGTVSLEAHKKGINMSRVMRTFYEHKDATFDLDLLETLLLDYRTSLGSLDAYLILRFNYPMVNESLRSGLAGYQYYQVALEARMDRAGVVRKFVHFDFVYSSTCPCSYELSQHAIQERGVAAVPHSQRSVARVSVELNGFLWLEEVRDLCLAALHTETQVMVKREDEQAFAELNAAHLKFVEDAVRLLHEQLDPEPRIKDFKIIASHQESLHSHDAVSALVKGVQGGFTPEVDPQIFATMIHR